MWGIVDDHILDLFEFLQFFHSSCFSHRVHPLLLLLSFIDFNSIILEFGMLILKWGNKYGKVFTSTHLVIKGILIRRLVVHEQYQIVFLFSCLVLSIVSRLFLNVEGGWKIESVYYIKLISLDFVFLILFDYLRYSWRLVNLDIWFFDLLLRSHFSSHSFLFELIQFTKVYIDKVRIHMPQFAWCLNNNSATNGPTTMGSVWISFDPTLWTLILHWAKEDCLWCILG